MCTQAEGLDLNLSHSFCGKVMIILANYHTFQNAGNSF
jgi:hypothetical protein